MHGWLLKTKEDLQKMESYFPKWGGKWSARDLSKFNYIVGQERLTKIYVACDFPMAIPIDLYSQFKRTIFLSEHDVCVPSFAYILRGILNANSKINYLPSASPISKSVPIRKRANTKANKNRFLLLLRITMLIDVDPRSEKRMCLRWVFFDCFSFSRLRRLLQCVP